MVSWPVWRVMIFGKVVGFPAAALLAGQGGFTGVGAAVWFSGGMRDAQFARREMPTGRPCRT